MLKWNREITWILHGVLIRFSIFHSRKLSAARVETKRYCTAFVYLRTIAWKGKWKGKKGISAWLKRSIKRQTGAKLLKWFYLFTSSCSLWLNRFKPRFFSMCYSYCVRQMVSVLFSDSWYFDSQIYNKFF